MVRDYGFDLPDTRHVFFSNDEKVSVKIVRHWYQDEEDCYTQFKVSFDITKGDVVTHLPVGTDESKACKIAHELYEQTEEDIEETESWNSYETQSAAEQRVGA